MPVQPTRYATRTWRQYERRRRLRTAGWVVLAILLALGANAALLLAYL